VGTENEKGMLDQSFNALRDYVSDAIRFQTSQRSNASLRINIPFMLVLITLKESALSFYAYLHMLYLTS
jgi:hypothetical protein